METQPRRSKSIRDALLPGREVKSALNALRTWEKALTQEQKLRPFPNVTDVFSEAKKIAEDPAIKDFFDSRGVEDFRIGHGDKRLSARVISAHVANQYGGDSIIEVLEVNGISLIDADKEEGLLAALRRTDPAMFNSLGSTTPQDLLSSFKEAIENKAPAKESVGSRMINAVKLGSEALGQGTRGFGRGVGESATALKADVGARMENRRIYKDYKRKVKADNRIRKENERVEQARRQAEKHWHTLTKEENERKGRVRSNIKIGVAGVAAGVVGAVGLGAMVEAFPPYLDSKPPSQVIKGMVKSPTDVSKEELFTLGMIGLSGAAGGLAASVVLVSERRKREKEKKQGFGNF